jgi:transcriptional regulator CtsR
VGISDLIASFLQEGLDEAEDGVLEVQRSDLAQRFNCVPSQINYVMSTRFSPERGYIVESRRGGNGYIRITRVRVDRQTLMMHVINSLGDSVDLPSARAILTNLVTSGALEENLGRTILASVGDKALAAVPRQTRDRVRADILKQVLILQV